GGADVDARDRRLRHPAVPVGVERSAARPAGPGRRFQHHGDRGATAAAGYPRPGRRAADRRSVPVGAAPADRVLLPAELPGARHDRGLRHGLIGAAAPPPVTDPPPAAAAPPVTDGRSPVRGEGPGPADPHPGSLSSPPRSSPRLTPVYGVSPKLVRARPAILGR